MSRISKVYEVVSKDSRRLCKGIYLQYLYLLVLWVPYKPGIKSYRAEAILFCYIKTAALNRINCSVKRKYHSNW